MHTQCTLKLALQLGCNSAFLRLYSHHRYLSWIWSILWRHRIWWGLPLIRLRSLPLGLLLLSWVVILWSLPLSLLLVRLWWVVGWNFVHNSCLSSLLLSLGFTLIF